jgi:hypothetical protein
MGCMDPTAENYNPDATLGSYWNNQFPFGQVSSIDESNPCIYDDTDYSLNVQNYPGDSDSQDQ